MSSRRRVPHPDMASVKKSRAAFVGAVTKALDKITAIPHTDPAEVRAINTKDIDRILASLERTQKGFHQTIEDGLEFCPAEEEDDGPFMQEEDVASESFHNSLAATRDLADQLLTLKSVLNGLSDFRCDLAALQDSLAEKPESNQASALQALELLFTNLRREWQSANLDSDHPVKAELDSCRKILTCLGADVALAKDKTDSHSTITSTSSTSKRTIFCTNNKSDLPVIDVPEFHGDIMTWSTFWASFESTIGSRKDLTNTKKLHYLRMAIKDADTQKLLHSPTETPDMYLDVVKELKRRFDRTREIHRLLTKNIIQLSSPKQTRVDLRRLTDSVNQTIECLKATISIHSSHPSSIYFCHQGSRHSGTSTQKRIRECLLSASY